MKKALTLIIFLSLLFSLVSCFPNGSKKGAPGCGTVPSSKEALPMEIDETMKEHVHFYDPEDGDSIKLSQCKYDGCHVLGRIVGEDEMAPVLKELFYCDEKKEEITAFCREFYDDIKQAKPYDPERDAYKENSLLSIISRKAVKKAELLDEYRDIVSDIDDVAELFSLLNNGLYAKQSAENRQFATEFQEYYYKIELACYNSMYREYVFREEDGWDSETLDDEIDTAQEYSDKELTELQDAADALDDEISGMDDPFSSDAPELMEKYVEASNALARRLGYSDYYDYAFSNEYFRDYTYGDIASFTSYVKEYIVPLWVEYDEKNIYDSVSEMPDFAYSSVYGSFVTDDDACASLYSFLKKVEACQSGKDSYYESADNAFKLGRVRTSVDSGAFGTAFTGYLSCVGSPYMCFTNNYTGVLTFVHEHGHYFACIEDSSDQVSFDVNEAQSQGAEMLYFAHLEDFFEGHSDASYGACLDHKIYTDLMTIIECCAVNEFEMALYSNDFSGVEDPDGKIADGVTSDEYDYLFDCILSDYGLTADRPLWRISALGNPCYYISYAVSLIPSFEVLVLSKTEGFESAAKAYLSFFEFPFDAGFEERDVSDVEYMCSFAGLASPFEESSFASICNALG
ncbi:MAG: hypothetical protein IJT70_08175 [Clostridia bacterium]|nr:hypothetical protein [Clostridia bacterium]